MAVADERQSDDQGRRSAYEGGEGERVVVLDQEAAGEERSSVGSISVHFGWRMTGRGVSSGEFSRPIRLASVGPEFI